MNREAIHLTDAALTSVTAVFHVKHSLRALSFFHFFHNPGRFMFHVKPSVVLYRWEVCR